MDAVNLGDAPRPKSAALTGVPRPASVSAMDLFATGNDVDNRAAVAAVGTDDLDLVGIGVHGPTNQVDKIFKGAELYRS